MLDERIRRYKDADINKISYKIRTGKIVDAIVHQSEETDCDLIVMASSKIILYVRVGKNSKLTSNTVKSNYTIQKYRFSQ